MERPLEISRYREHGAGGSSMDTVDIRYPFERHFIFTTRTR